MARRIRRIRRVGTLRNPPKPKTRVPSLEMTVPDPPSPVQVLEDPRQAELRRLLGDDPRTMRLIKRILRLEQRLPGASLPELIAYDWLQRRGVRFDYQGEAFGGRVIRGGVVPDFVIWVGPGVLVWRIQGDYWHTQLAQKEEDLEDALRLLSGTVYGQPVWAVVDCWESDIYQDPERVFRLAMAGIGLREQYT